MRILVVDPIAEVGLAVLRERASVDLAVGLTEAGLIDRVGGYDALVVRSQTRVTAEVLAAAARLCVVARAGIGVDNIDVDEASRRGIVVVNAPLSVVQSAAEHTIAMMLTLARRIPQAHASVRDGEWRRARFAGVEVHGKTLGVVGLGHIGRTVARLGVGLGMRVVAADPYVGTSTLGDLDVTLVGYDELFQTADFVTVHVPLLPATRGLIGAAAFARMKVGARLINCARGGIVDDEALAEALRGGRLAGAAIDVFAEEPPRGSPLQADDLADRVVLTPHIGGSTTEAQDRAAEQIAREVLTVLTEGVSRFAVNVPALVPEAVRRLAPQVELARRLGRMVGQMLDGAPRALAITYGGTLAGEDTRPLRAAVLGGLLSVHFPDAPALLNAHLLAENAGIEVSEERRPDAEYGPAGTLTVTGHGERNAHRLVGAVVGGRHLLLAVDEYRVDIEAEGVLVLFRYHDHPGVVGKIGSLLGAADVNIAGMRVGRLAPRGDAILVLSLDERPAEELVERAATEIGTVWIRTIVL